MLVGYPPGGGMEAIARVLAPKLGEALGQQLVVENRPGASGGVAAEALADSPADGESFAKQGATPTPSTPEELRAQIAEEVKRWAAVVRDAGLKLE